MLKSMIGPAALAVMAPLFLAAVMFYLGMATSHADMKNKTHEVGGDQAPLEFTNKTSLWDDLFGSE